MVSCITDMGHCCDTWHVCVIISGPTLIRANLGVVVGSFPDRQGSKNCYKASHNLLADGGSRLPFVKNATSGKHNKVKR